MKKPFLPALGAVVLAASVASWLAISSATIKIQTAADSLIQEVRALEDRSSTLLTTSYTASSGDTITVTTNIGDAQDGESADIYDRHESRVAAAKVKWPS